MTTQVPISSNVCSSCTTWGKQNERKTFYLMWYYYLIKIKHETSFVHISDTLADISSRPNYYASQLCFARLSHGLGVRPVRLFVRVSVTPLSSIKTVQARITKSSLLAAPITLVFNDKISCPWERETPFPRKFSSNEGVKEGYPFPQKVVIADS